MIKQRGFNVLEVLLVLVVVAIISIISIRRYQIYQRHLQLAQIKNDITAIQSALNRYYHESGCRLDGHFDRDLTPALSALGLNLPGRPPEIPLGNAYEAAIVDTHQVTANKKPVYGFQVSAHFSPSFSEQRMRWYQNALGASRVVGQELIWITMPGNTTSTLGKNFWVMTSRGERFRQRENAARESLLGKDDQLATSPSYCVH